jgi:hypothetical protein
MSTRGTHLALLIAFSIAFALPKRVECGHPGASCGHAGKFRTICTDYEIEPIGFYALELVLGRDVGFAYSSQSDCR